VRVPLLLSVDVVPAYAQVVAFDETDPDGLPVPETGGETVVVGFTGLCVATRSDWVASQGAVVPVRLEVWEVPGPDSDDLHLAWEGEITVGATGLTVGSAIGADLHTVALPHGRHRIQVLTRPAQEPDRVVLVLG
jgi:hypothetical protein